MTMFTDHQVRGHSWRERGTGRPVVFLHGLGGTRRSWGPQLLALGERFRCIAWDMPGYGDAEPVRPLTYPAIADRLTQLLDVIGEERVDLVGLSFGGMHAMHTALLHPDRVHAMVLADTSPAFGMDGTRRDEWIASRLAPLARGEEPRDFAADVIDSITATALTGTARVEAIDAFSHISAEGFRAAVECLPDNDVRHVLHRLHHPTLVVVGELDRETPPSYARALHDGLSDSELRVIAGAGHLTPAEAPDEFTRLVADFLTTHADDPALERTSP